MRNAPPILSAAALAAALAGLGLSGCASAPAARADLAVAAPAAPFEPTGTSNYGLFLAGEAALQAGRSADAVQYFSRAMQGDGDLPAETQAMIREKAFIAAVMAGEVDEAARLAPQPDPADSSPSQRLARLVRAVDALAENRGKEADQILNTPGRGLAYAGGLILLKPWAAAAAGDAKRATAMPDGPSPALTRVAAQFSQALLLERAKRFDEAETDYKSLMSGQFAGLYTVPYGEFLQRRGRGREAATLYREALQRNPTAREVRRALERLEARKSPAPAMPSLREGAARALTVAAEMSLIDKRTADGQMYLRLALRLDPQQTEAWIYLGDILAQTDDPAGARAAYARVPAASSDWMDARQRIIASYQAEGDLDTAVRLAEELARIAPRERDAQLTLADLYRATERFPQAVAVLDKLIAADPAGADWAIYYERATALDRSGRWPEAEKDLEKALSLRPDQPDVLNYLGYSWVSRGEKLPQALTMLNRAYLAQPNSGEIADSLGWAYYHLGDYKQAVQRLERAVALEPTNAEIIDHLGDAYWRAGRKTEAQYQWTRVLSLQPTPTLKAAAERKLSAGLDAPTPLASRS